MGNPSVSTAYADPELMALKISMTPPGRRTRMIQFIRRKVLDLRAQRVARAEANAANVRAEVEALRLAAARPAAFRQRGRGLKRNPNAALVTARPGASLRLLNERRARVSNAFAIATALGACARAGSGFLLPLPGAPEDRPSLSIRDGDGGRLLWSATRVAANTRGRGAGRARAARRAARGSPVSATRQSRSRKQRRLPGDPRSPPIWNAAGIRAARSPKDISTLAGSSCPSTCAAACCAFTRAVRLVKAHGARLDRRVPADPRRRRRQRRRPRSSASGYAEGAKIAKRMLGPVGGCASSSTPTKTSRTGSASPKGSRPRSRCAPRAGARSGPGQRLARSARSSRSLASRR